MHGMDFMPLSGQFAPEVAVSAARDRSSVRKYQFYCNFYAAEK